MRRNTEPLHWHAWRTVSVEAKAVGNSGCRAAGQINRSEAASFRLDHKQPAIKRKVYALGSCQPFDDDDRLVHEFPVVGDLADYAHIGIAHIEVTTFRRQPHRIPEVIRPDIFGRIVVCRVDALDLLVAIYSRANPLRTRV